MGSRSRFDHDAAFALFASLEPGKRSLGEVSRRIGVSLTSVRRIARRDNWEERVAEIDRKAAEKALRAAVRSREVRNLEVIKFVDDYVTSAKGRLDAGTLEIRAGDVPQLVKLAELLEGEATSRVEVGQVQQVLVLVLNTAVRFVPEDTRPAFLDAFDRQVKALLGPAEEGTS